ncbi:MAG: VWA domain-containing protein [Deltaproteobacteria bacterium]
MNVTRLIERFHGSITSHRPNDWELEEYLRPLAAIEEERQLLILRQVPVIWPVSHALCFNYLAKAAEVLNCLDPQQFPDWVGGLLDAYEREGLRSAQHFMDDVEKHFLCKIRGESGLMLDKVQTRLLSYVHGISGTALELEAGIFPTTDTAKIVLPSELTLFPDEAKNFLLYKFAATVQCGHLHFGTYRLRPGKREQLLTEIVRQSGKKYTGQPIELSGFFELFRHPSIAADLFLILQNWRIASWIRESFPGLFRDVQPLLAELFAPLSVKAKMTRQEAMKWLERYLHRLEPRPQGSEKVPASLPMFRILRVLHEVGKTMTGQPDILQSVWTAYKDLARFEGGYHGLPYSLIFGGLDYKGAKEAILKRRREDKKKFIHMLAGLVAAAEKKRNHPEQAEPAESGHAGERGAEEGALLLLVNSEEQEDEEREVGTDRKAQIMRFLTVGGKEITLTEEMQHLVSRITSDLGGLPVRYISSAAGLAGQGLASLEEVELHEGQQDLPGALLYDEWDYRRKGYKKDWCHVLEKKVPEVAGSFVGQTIEKHRGLLLKLRRQFEMMRNQQMLMKRQRDGDDIDLDAVTEFFADQRAGLSPSERFFMRLVRDQRDIAVFFLVDMSSSTEGWIMNAIKESLLLMGEALNVLGDRFAIYGFSGMRRLRSDVFLVKGIEESYDETIRSRIAGIKPQEYTRMGPPIRHLIRLMDSVEARARLLIILSDGKPEDYDDYKGQYAIEDTRHALIEAKAAGVHPFCITVDRQAKEYIEHMYGEVNFIQITDVAQLPLRIPAVYQTLTAAC